MTTIVITKDSIASDSQFTSSMIESFKTPKIKETKDCVFASTGYANIEDLIHHYYGERQEWSSEWKDDWFFVYHKKSKTPRVYTIGTQYTGDVVRLPFAMGSGREFAYGALSMGASASQAVKIACKYDPRSGGKVKEISL